VDTSKEEEEKLSKVKSWRKIEIKIVPYWFINFLFSNHFPSSSVINFYFLILLFYCFHAKRLRFFFLVFASEKLFRKLFMENLWDNKLFLFCLNVFPLLLSHLWGFSSVKGKSWFW
jgi:hypothetical protein